MTLMIAHVNKEFLEGGFEILVKWISDDLLAGKKNLDEIHQSYNTYTFGKEKKQLTEDQFFIAYKSAELVYQDLINYKNEQGSS